MSKNERLVTIEAANPSNDVPPCLGKKRYETEEEAAAGTSPNHRVYFCAWDGPHYHTSAHGYKGARRGR
jgi:hypothetical protein